MSMYQKLVLRLLVQILRRTISGTILRGPTADEERFLHEVESFIEHEDEVTV